jgi:hypothetical protein
MNLRVHKRWPSVNLSSCTLSYTVSPDIKFVVTSNVVHRTIQQFMNKSTLVAERFKAWVCCRSLATISGSNPAGGMDIYCDCYVR